MNVNTIIETDAEAEGDTHDYPCERHQPIVKTREEHTISRRDIDPDALKVLYRLARNNYIAYLVGGGVRDLLLGRVPKDFDISTNAKPEQIRSLFRNCILIGRRFRLAHIRYGDKIIETSTFRSTPKQLADPSDPEADLFQRDDNLFGSPAEDALRRDFTVNGLFYDIESFSIIDYVGGMEDLKAKRIRSIGDPCIRFREDPVRMVRAIRFASRLGFSLDPATEEAIHQYGPELTKASPARLLEEITRLFAFSSGERAVKLLRSTGLLDVILPEVGACIGADDMDVELFWKRLRSLDCGDTVLPDATPALIFAVLLNDPLKMYLEKTWTFETTPRFRFDKLYSFMQPISQRLRFPKKLVDRIIHMYLNQNRFCSAAMARGKPGSLANFVTQEAFHESLALAEIMLEAEGGDLTRLNQWREMLQERIYGREEAGRNGYGHGHHNGGGNGNGSVAGAHGAAGSNSNNRTSSQSIARVEVSDTVAADIGEDSEEQNGVEEGRRLSRSARRRRNKRMRRMQQQEKGGDGSESVAVVVKTDSENGDAAVKAVAVDSDEAGVGEVVTSESSSSSSSYSSTSSSTAKSGRSRHGRRGRKVEKSEKVVAPGEGESSKSVEVGEKQGRLLDVVEEGGAAAPGKVVKAKPGKAAEKKKPAGKVVKKAEEKEKGKKATAGKAAESRKDVKSGKREVAGKDGVEDALPPKPLTAAAFWKEPEPEPEPEPKKKVGRKGKAGSEAKGKGKGAVKKDKKKGDLGASAETKPLAMDRADEAEIPMHWLDEI